MADKFASGDKSIMDYFSSAFGEFPCLFHSRKARELYCIRMQSLGERLKSNNKKKGDIKEEHTIKDCPSSNDDTKKGEVHTSEGSLKSGGDVSEDQDEVHTNQVSPKSGDDTQGDQVEVHTNQDSLKSCDDTQGDQVEVHTNQDSLKSCDDTQGDQVEVHTNQDSLKSCDDTQGDQVEVHTNQDSLKSCDDTQGDQVEVHTNQDSLKSCDDTQGDQVEVHTNQDSLKSCDDTQGDQVEVHTNQDSPKSGDDTQGDQVEVHTNQDSLKSCDDTQGDQVEVHTNQDSLKSCDDTQGDQVEVHTNQDSLKSCDDTMGDQVEVHTNQDSPKSGDDTQGDQVEVHTNQDSPKSGDDTQGDQVEVHTNQDSLKSCDDTNGEQGEVHTNEDSPKSGDNTKEDGEEENYALIDFSDTVDTNFSVYALLALKDEDAGREACLAVQKHPFSIVARVNFAYFSCIINKREKAEKQLAWLIKLKKEDPEFFSELLEDATHEVVYCYSELGWEMKTETITAAEEAMQKYPSNSYFKLIYGISIRQSLNPTYMSLRPEVDLARALQRAVDVFVELMEDEKVDATRRALAYAELGEIISLQYDTELDDAMKRIKQNLRYTASDCYELALELDMEHHGALWRAGKYFRNVTREYDKSYKMIKKALVLHPNSVNHHQLGLTLKKLAISAKYHNKDYPGLLTYDPFPEKCKPEVNQGYIKENETHTSSDDVSRNSKVLGEEMKQDVQDSAISARTKDDLEHKPDNDDIEKMPEVNLRPCRGTFLPVCAQPGTTVMSGISVKRDIPDRVKLCWMWKSPLDSKTFSRGDKYVMETMEHFKKAVKVSRGDNTSAVYDLALMHKALGEYNEALDRFQQILLKKNNDMSYSVNAFEQTGLVLIEMSKSAERENEDDFIKTGKVMLLMSIICQSRVLYRNRKFRNYNKEIWRDFFNLGLYIERIKRGNKFSARVNAQEDWLIELIRRHCRGLQVLKDILNFNIMEASSVQSLESRTRRYVREGRYEDAMTFLALLKLTSHGQVESTFRDSDISFKVYVHAAKTRFLQVCKNKDTLKIIANSNMQVARWIFRWAFENKFDDNTLKIPSRSADTSQTFPANYISEVYQSDDVIDNQHVILLYDPEDDAGVDCVTTLYNLLHIAFGLRSKFVIDYGPMHSTSDISLVLARSPLLLVVLASKEVSTKFNDYMNAAVSANKPVDSVAETLSVVTSHGNILALLTEDASLPPLLKEHRVLPYPQELQKFEVDFLKSREYVITICKLFCQLLNSDVEIT